MFWGGLNGVFFVLPFAALAFLLTIGVLVFEEGFGVLLGAIPAFLFVVFFAMI